VEKFTRRQARPAWAFLLPKIWPPKGGFFMPFFNPYSLAAKALVTVLVAAGLFGSGWYYGRYYRGLECDIAAAKVREASDKALREAIQEKAVIESQLAAISHKIDIDDAKRQTEIDRIRDDNRRLAAAIRLRQPAKCPSGSDAVPENSGAAASADGADPIEFSGACARFLADLAADAERVREQAIVGQKWAVAVKRAQK
jgi:hypothetical protein